MCPRIHKKAAATVVQTPWNALILLTLAVMFLSGCGGGSSSGSGASLTATTTTLVTSASSVTQGNALTLTATVTPSAATGTVTFYDGSTSLGTAALSSGSAVFNISTLDLGTHTLKATYGGATSYKTSSSSTVSVTVTSPLTTTTTTLSASASSVTEGSDVTLTAVVSPSAATGTVIFYDGSASIGSGTLSSGVASFKTNSLNVRTHTILARYGGAGSYATSTSNSVTITVTPSSGKEQATTTTLIVSSSTIVTGSSVNLLALVSPMTTSGNVTFYDGGSSVGTVTFSSGIASLTLATLDSGTHALSASFGGSSSYLSSTSAAVTLQVLPAATGSWTSGTCGYGTAAFRLSSGTLDESSSKYSTAVNDESAICVTGSGTNLLLTAPVISTSGTTSSTDNSSFYGLNAAVLNYNGGNLSILGGSISTTGQGGNGAFAYGTGNSSLFGTTVRVTAPNSHGLYAAGGGAIFANNVIASSTGDSGSIVATDRGGGAITLVGGSFTASGNRSAGIYSTGAVIAYGGTFSTSNAEAVVIEGSNVVTLNGTTLNAVSGTSEHRGIFLYQSTSGDPAASNCGTGACFTMTGGQFNYSDTYNSSADSTANCAAFVASNQVAHFTLTDVAVNNGCPTLLLSALNTNWNFKGGTMVFKAYGDTLTGDVIVDSASSADITLYSSSQGASKLTGKINTANTGLSVSLTLDASSKWVVTGTSYLTSLNDADSTYSNITCQTAGCKVYVGGTAITIP